MKIGEELRRELGQGDAAFAQAVRQALDGLETEARPVKKKMSFGLAVALVLVLMIGVTAFAAANGWSVLLERLPGVACTPEAEHLVQQGQNETCGNEDVRFVVREAICDGYGVYLALDVIPQKEDVVLLEWHTSKTSLRPDSPAERLGAEDAGDMTVEQYCEANGLRMIEAYAGFYRLDMKSWECSLLTYTHAERNPDGSLTIVMDTAFDGDPEKVGIQCDAYEIRRDDSTEIWFEDMPLHLTSVGSAAKEEKLCQQAVTVDEETGLRLDAVKVTRTPIGCYVDVTWSVSAEVPEEIGPRLNEFGYYSGAMTYTCGLVCMDGIKTDDRDLEVFVNSGREMPDGRRVHHTVWKMAPDTVLPSTVEIEVNHYAWKQPYEIDVVSDLETKNLGVYAFALE